MIKDSAFPKVDVKGQRHSIPEGRCERKRAIQYDQRFSVPEGRCKGAKTQHSRR